MGENEFITLGDKDFLTSPAARELLRDSVRGYGSATWPAEAIGRLPFIDTIYAATCNVFDWFLHHLEAEGISYTSYPVIINMVYSLDGSSTCSTIKPSMQTDFNVGYAIRFDIRIVFEALAIACVSPISSAASNVDMALSLFQMALSTRINSVDQGEMAKIAVGLISSAPRYSADFGRGWKGLADLNRLVEESGISEQQIDVIIKTVVSRVICHELAHVLFERSVASSSRYSEVVAFYQNWLQETIEHQNTHDAEWQRLAALAGVAVHSFGITVAIDGLTDASAADADVLRKLDLNELMCDVLTIENLAKSLGSADLLDCESVNTARCVINLTDLLIQEFAGAPSFFGRSQVLMKSFENERSTSDLDEEDHRTLQRIQINNRNAIKKVFYVRRLLNMKHFDAVIARERALALNASVVVASSMFYDKRIDEQWAVFEIKLQNLLHLNVFSHQAACTLSSRGNGVLTLLSRSSVSSSVSQYGDPFALYMFGFNFKGH